jgi:hypothetical protein
MKTQNTPILLIAIVAGFLTLAAGIQAQAQMIEINVLVNQPITNSILLDLGTHGHVLDVISQINGVTVRAHSSELSIIQSLPYVTGANPDGLQWSLLEVFREAVESKGRSRANRKHGSEIRSVTEAR